MLDLVKKAPAWIGRRTRIAGAEGVGEQKQRSTSRAHEEGTELGGKRASEAELSTAMSMPPASPPSPLLPAVVAYLGPPGTYSHQVRRLDKDRTAQ